MPALPKRRAKKFDMHPLPLTMGEVAVVRLTERVKKGGGSVLPPKLVERPIICNKPKLPLMRELSA